MIPVVYGAGSHLPLTQRVVRTAYSGFTLLELIIAISVFGVMAAMAYGGLRTVLESKQLLDTRLQALAQLQSAFSLLRRDIEQAVIRAVRDEAGAPLPPFAGNTGNGEDGELLALTRAGWSNPRGMKRSTLQRVTYRWHDQTLHRVAWDALDRVEDTGTVDLALLGGVEAMRLRFLDQRREWHAAWPPEETDNPELPLAVELTLTLEGRGELLRLFCLAGSGQTQPSAASK
ncbi:MAG: type II secretion system minor pseudopilin GspJ [Gammaproteobacteria bacterium]